MNILVLQVLAIIGAGAIIAAAGLLGIMLFFRIINFILRGR